MKNKMFKLVSVAGIALALGACASNPPVQEEVAVTTPPPVRDTTPPPVRDEVVTSREVVQGPPPGTVQDFIVNVGERVYFDTDRYNLDADDMAVLNRQAAWLQAYPTVRIMVAGNCDERGTREYNLGLGERRANSVKDYLVSRGISADRIETISYGKERPIDGRSTPEAWEVNRNSHTQIVSGQVG